MQVLQSGSSYYDVTCWWVWLFDWYSYVTQRAPTSPRRQWLEILSVLQKFTGTIWLQLNTTVGQY